MSVLEEILFMMPLTTVHMAVAQTSVASSKLKIKLDSHEDTCSCRQQFDNA